MRKVLCMMLLSLVTFMSFGQTIYYQQIDKKVSVGVGKTDKETSLVILTNKPELDLIVNNHAVETRCNEIDKKNYEHIVTIPNFTLDMVKDGLRVGSVFINGEEYSALELGAAITAAEWYCSYYKNRPFDDKAPRFNHKPFMMPQEKRGLKRRDMK